MPFVPCWEQPKALANLSGYKVTPGSKWALGFRPCPGRAHGEQWTPGTLPHQQMLDFILAPAPASQSIITTRIRTRRQLQTEAGKTHLVQSVLLVLSLVGNVGRLGFERSFPPLTQHFLSKCCTFCSCFLLFCLWEITLERSGKFGSLSRFGGWSNSAVFLRKGAAVGRAPGTRQELPLECVTEHFVEHLVHLQRRPRYLKGFEHVCACVWTIAARQSLDVGTKGRKKSNVSLKKMNCQRKLKGYAVEAQCWLETDLWKSGGRRWTAFRHS